MPGGHSTSSVGEFAVSGPGPVRETEISRELFRLHRATEDLYKNVSELETRLQSVSRAEPHSTSEKTSEQATSTSTGSSIQEATRKVELVAMALYQLRNRLEI
jgi:hypothetical protein